MPDRYYGGLGDGGAVPGTVVAKILPVLSLFPHRAGIGVEQGVLFLQENSFSQFSGEGGLGGKGRM